MPPDTGQHLGKAVGLITLAICRAFGSQAHQVIDAGKSFSNEIQPGIKQFKNFSQPYYENATNYINTSYHDFLNTEQGQTLTRYLTNAGELGKELGNAAYITIKSTAEIASTSAPMMAKVTNLASATVDKAGTVINWTVGKADAGLDIAINKSKSGLHSVRTWLPGWVPGSLPNDNE